MAAVLSLRPVIVRVLAAALLALPVAAVADVRPELPSPGVSAPGVDVPCTPTVDRPVPVVLVHGTRADRTVNWAYMGPELAEAGWCVYSLDLPDRGQAPIAESVAALARRVDEVRAETGAREVSIVGHSLGGIVARDYVKRGGGRHVVDDIVAMGTPHTGYYTEPPGDEVDKLYNTECPACFEMARGTPYMLGLNDGDMTPGQASYTSIITEYDGVAVPKESQYLPAGKQVANIHLQTSCPEHVVDHLTLAVDPLVRDWIIDALSRKGPAAGPVACTPEP